MAVQSSGQIVVALDKTTVAMLARHILFHSALPRTKLDSRKTEHGPGEQQQLFDQNIPLISYSLSLLVTISSLGSYFT